MYIYLLKKWKIIKFVPYFLSLYAFIYIYKDEGTGIIGKMNKKIHSFFDTIRPVKGVAYFLFLFLVFEFLWKLCIHIGPDGESFIVLGRDMTQIIYPLCELDARIVHWLIHDLFGYSNYRIQGDLIYFEGELKMKIIWSCTSIKQWAMFLFIMIFYWGPWKKKAYFIPISLIFLSFINVLRLVISAFLIKDGFPEWFIPVNEALKGINWDDTKATYWRFYEDWYHFFHDGFFRWVYYDGIMFLIWLLWQEKFNLPYQRLKQQNTSV